MVDENPLADVAANPSRLFIAVLADPADRTRLEPLARQTRTPEALALGARVAYVWCPDGIIGLRDVSSRSTSSPNSIPTSATTGPRPHSAVLKPYAAKTCTGVGRPRHPAAARSCTARSSARRLSRYARATGAAMSGLRGAP